MNKYSFDIIHHLIPIPTMKTSTEIFLFFFPQCGDLSLIFVGKPSRVGEKENTKKPQ